MAHVSWFPLTPNASADPYDNDLAIHLNLGKNGMMQARRRTRGTLYWAAGFEVIMPVTREVRFLGELFSGDPFSYEETCPAFQSGSRWYKSPVVQMDLVFRGPRNGSVETEASTGAEFSPGWNDTTQAGLRVLFDVFR